MRVHRNAKLGLAGRAAAHPLSEPESRLVARFVLRLRPRISIWFHQRLDLVDLSGGDAAIERRFACEAGLPLVRLPRYPGSVVSWENATLPGSTAFVVELPAGTPSTAATARYAAAVLAIATRRARRGWVWPQITPGMDGAAHADVTPRAGSRRAPGLWGAQTRS